MSRQKYGGREKGTPNRLTSKVKDKLERVLDELPNVLLGKYAG